MPKNRVLHPDYTDAPERRRWAGGPLADLFKLLCGEVMPLTPTYRVLPNGACVSMVQDNLGLRSVRISRRAKPETEKATLAFRREVLTFQEHFGIESWVITEDPQARGIAAIIMEQAAV